MNMENPLELIWAYKLVPEGFQISLKCRTAGECCTMQHIIPWHDFICGLLIGWGKYHQDNHGYTSIIRAFLQEQSAKGNCTLSHEREIGRE